MNKPFDLEAAKRGEPIETANGKPMTFGAHLPNADVFCRVVVLDADGRVCTFSTQGASAFDHHLLRMAAKTEWVNLYRTVHGTVLSACFAIKTDADSADTGRIACFEIPV